MDDCEYLARVEFLVSVNNKVKVISHTSLSAGLNAAGPSNFGFTRSSAQRTTHI